MGESLRVVWHIHKLISPLSVGQTATILVFRVIFMLSAII